MVLKVSTRRVPPETFAQFLSYAFGGFIKRKEGGYMVISHLIVAHGNFEEGEINVNVPPLPIHLNVDRKAMVMYVFFYRDDLKRIFPMFPEKVLDEVGKHLEGEIRDVLSDILKAVKDGGRKKVQGR